MSDNADWTYTTEPVGDRHALCCRTCRAAEARVTELEARNKVQADLIASERRTIACNVKDASAAAEARVTELEAALALIADSSASPNSRDTARAALAASTKEGTP